MFSPSGAITPAASTRTSRRRQRPLSNERSIPKAKRQRSTLSDHTFIPPDGSPEMEETKSYKTPALVKRDSSSKEVSGSQFQKDIAVRGKKQRSADRNSKGDGSVVLTTNDTYTVSKLPAFPDRLRADVTTRQHGAIYSDSGYALTLTHTNAIVWQYSLNASSPETFQFAIPHPSKHTSDPLPLGSLVSASASSIEPGLVVVIPTTGNITYWESIASAATLDLRLQRNGVETSITGMLSGEKVIQILNAESAGFMLAFSSGRIAYMSVRDGQGRPSITVQFLRGGNGLSNIGIFGSLRNALSSSSSHGDIAAIRAGRSERIGDRNVVLGTKKGKLQSWDINRGGHTALTAEAEIREAIVLAIKVTIPSLSELLIETFQLLDFAHMPSPSVELVRSSQEDDTVRLLLLTSLTDRQTSHYFLIEVTLRADEFLVSSIRPIKSYSTPINQTAISNTRLYLPHPSLVAYIVFDKAVVVVSMAKLPNSPGSQLIYGSHLFPQTFEDVIDFRGDINIEIVGSGMEEPHGPPQNIEDSKTKRHKPKYPATILLIRGGGVLRVAANDVGKLASRQAPQVTAKSKLEQAVFFGTLEHNPINFAVRPELEFPAQDVGEAALVLSMEILSSQTPYIPSVTASVEQNLRKRSAALRDLAKYLKKSGVELDRVTRWKLLWDAEKMEAATVLWKRYDTRLSEKPHGMKRGLLAELVEWIHEDYKSNPVEEAGELDRVRHWFVNDIARIHIALPWAYQVIKYGYQDGQKEHDIVMGLLDEANEFVVGALTTAFKFRMANVELYGLSKEPLHNGILEEDYEGLPEIWTSHIFIIENLRKQTELTNMLVEEYWVKPKEGGPSPALIAKVRDENSALIDISIRSHKERLQWGLAQNDPQLQIEAEQFQRAQTASAHQQIICLSKQLKLPDEAIALARKHELLNTLAEVLVYEINEYSRIILDKNADTAHKVRYHELRDIVDDCFNRFGSKWAAAFFDLQISFDLMQELLDKYPQHQKFLTEFLRERPQYAKVAWINEVTREKGFDQAAGMLLNLGLHREQDVWSKKIELSLGKLANLTGSRSGQEDGPNTAGHREAELTDAHDQLALIKIQDVAYGYVYPFISTAIDEDAEIELAIKNCSFRLLDGQPTFAPLFEQNMAHLIKHRALDSLSLIDLLTWIDSDFEEYPEFLSLQFYLALKATCHNDADGDEKVLSQRVIWRRCMLRDDWGDVNNTDQRGDFDVQQRLRNTALYHTFHHCLKNGFLGKDSAVKPIAPNHILGACTYELEHRYAKLDASIQENITADFNVEDGAFQVHLDKDRLENWYRATLELAQKDYEEDLALSTEEGLKMGQVRAGLQEVENAIASKEMKAAADLLQRGPRRPKANGSTSSFRSSIRQY